MAGLNILISVFVVLLFLLGLLIVKYVSDKYFWYKKEKQEIEMAMLEETKSR